MTSTNESTDLSLVQCLCAFSEPSGQAVVLETRLQNLLNRLFYAHFAFWGLCGGDLLHGSLVYGDFISSVGHPTAMSACPKCIELTDFILDYFVKLDVVVRYRRWVRFGLFGDK
jgi:hypothetical protein